MRHWVKVFTLVAVFSSIILGAVAVGLWQAGVFGGSTQDIPMPPVAGTNLLTIPTNNGTLCFDTDLHRLGTKNLTSVKSAGSACFGGVDNRLMAIVNPDGSSNGTKLVTMSFRWAKKDTTGRINRKSDISTRSLVAPANHYINALSMAALSKDLIAYIVTPTTGTATQVIVENLSNGTSETLTHTSGSHSFTPLVVHAAVNRRELLVIWYSSDLTSVLLATYKRTSHSVKTTADTGTLTVGAGSILPASMHYWDNKLVIGGNSTVYYYTYNRGWELQQTLTETATFGSRVCLSRDSKRLAVSSRDGSGSVWVYSRDTGNFTQLGSNYTVGASGITSDASTNQLGHSLLWSHHILYASKFGHAAQINVDASTATMWTGAGDVGDYRFLGGSYDGPRNLMGSLYNTELVDGTGSSGAHMQFYTQCDEKALS